MIKHIVFTKFENPAEQAPVADTPAAAAPTAAPVVAPVLFLVDQHHFQREVRMRGQFGQPHQLGKEV